MVLLQVPIRALVDRVYDESWNVASISRGRIIKRERQGQSWKKISFSARRTEGDNGSIPRGAEKFHEFRKHPRCFYCVKMWRESSRRDRGRKKTETISSVRSYLRCIPDSRGDYKDERRFWTRREEAGERGDSTARAAEIEGENIITGINRAWRCFRYPNKACQACL